MFKLQNCFSICLTVIFVFIFHCGYSNKIDSLQNLINTTNDDHHKIDLLYDLAHTYLNDNYNTSKSIKAAQDHLNLSRLKKYNKGVVSAYILIGYCYFKNKNYPNALENYFLALKYLKDTTDNKELVNCYISISFIYNKINNPKQAIFYNKKAFLGLKKQLNIDALSTCYLNFANSYKILKENNKEINYLYKGIELRKKHLQFNKLGNEYNKLGFAYWNLKKYDHALKYYNLYLQASIKNQDKYGIAMAYSNIGSTFFSKNEIRKSIEYFNKSISLEDENLPHTYLELVNSYCKLNQLNKASCYLKLSTGFKPDLNELMKAYNVMANAYKTANNKDKAIYYLELSNKIKDSINFISSYNIELIAKSQYNAEGIEAAIYQKEATQLLKENLKLKTGQNRFLIVILALIVLIGIFLAYLYRRRLLEKERKLNDAAKEKSLLIKELNFLKDQFNSHTTFNFLNFCYGNIYKLSSKTAQAIELFSDILRYSLKTNVEEKIPLENEIEHIENFLKLQKLLTSKLFVNLKYPQIINSKLLHPRILITFVENAFKHGKTNDKNAPIEISLEIEVNSIKLKIKNRKATKNRNLKGDTGIGHKNVDQILRIFYKDKHHIHVEDEGEFYACSLTLND